MSPEQRLGQVGESWVYHQLKKRGYSPRISDSQAQNCDLIVGNVCIEVKLSRQSELRRKSGDNWLTYPRWQWNIHQTAKDKDCCFILIAVDRKGYYHPFIIPSANLAGRFNPEINSHPRKYKGWMSKFLGEWGVIEFLLQQSYLDDGPTYHQWKSGQRVVV